VRAACREPFDGIFIDNLQMGKLGIPFERKQSSMFVGCRCRHCRKKFKRLTGCDIPKSLPTDTPLTRRYLQFRTDTTTAFVRAMAKITKRYGKQFGTNCFDPKFNPSYTYGTDIAALDRYQDYLLFENHSLPNKSYTKNNRYIDTLIRILPVNKPVFVVSYKKGIGYDRQFSQADINRLYSEARACRFHVCLKASEFITAGTWHNLDLSHITRPTLVPLPRHAKNTRANVFLRYGTMPMLDSIGNAILGRGLELFMENRSIRRAFGFVYRLTLK
jgi:hypothetical protein